MNYFAILLMKPYNRDVISGRFPGLQRLYGISLPIIKQWLIQPFLLLTVAVSALAFHEIPFYLSS